MAVGALGAPGGPSLQSLVTLAAPPDQVGRALAGKSMLESTAAALRGPLFYALYDATLDTMPGAIWLLATVSLLSFFFFARLPLLVLWVKEG